MCLRSIDGVCQPPLAGLTHQPIVESQSEFVVKYIPATPEAIATSIIVVTMHKAVPVRWLFPIRAPFDEVTPMDPQSELELARFHEVRN